jgi:hypothetical protein
MYEKLREVIGKLAEILKLPSMSAVAPSCGCPVTIILTKGRAAFVLLSITLPVITNGFCPIEDNEKKARKTKISIFFIFPMADYHCKNKLLIGRALMEEYKHKKAPHFCEAFNKALVMVIQVNR